MVSKLQILLKDASSIMIYPTSIYRDMKDSPRDYKLLNIGRKKEIRKIGRDDIPKKGGVANFFDNDFYEPGKGYDQPNSIHTKKVRIKEFDLGKRDETMAIIEEVRSLKYIGNGEVELIIQRYLIREKEKR